MSRERALRLVCVCNRNLADVVPAMFSEHADEVAVLDSLMVIARPHVNMVTTRVTPRRPTSWWVENPEALNRWAYSWKCVCGRNPRASQATITAWWKQADATSDTPQWRDTRMVDA